MAMRHPEPNWSAARPTDATYGGAPGAPRVLLFSGLDSGERSVVRWILSSAPFGSQSSWDRYCLGIAIVLGSPSSVPLELFPRRLAFSAALRSALLRLPRCSASCSRQRRLRFQRRPAFCAAPPSAPPRLLRRLAFCATSHSRAASPPAQVVGALEARRMPRLAIASLSPANVRQPVGAALIAAVEVRNFRLVTPSSLSVKVYYIMNSMILILCFSNNTFFLLILIEQSKLI